LSALFELVFGLLLVCGAFRIVGVFPLPRFLLLCAIVLFGTCYVQANSEPLKPLVEGLRPGAVIDAYKAQGFKVVRQRHQLGQNMYQSQLSLERVDRLYYVDVFGTEDDNVYRVDLFIINISSIEDLNELAFAFFDEPLWLDVGSMNWEKARDWVRQNLGKEASLLVGDIEYILHARGSTRMLEIVAKK